MLARIGRCVRTRTPGETRVLIFFLVAVFLASLSSSNAIEQLVLLKLKIKAFRQIRSGYCTAMSSGIIKKVISLFGFEFGLIVGKRNCQFVLELLLDEKKIEITFKNTYAIVSTFISMLYLSLPSISSACIAEDICTGI